MDYWRQKIRFIGIFVFMDWSYYLYNCVRLQANNKRKQTSKMVKLITFTDDRMTISATKCVQSAMQHGADGYSLWTMNDLSPEFKETMADVLKHERGAGFYCWKPYIVHREMCKLQDGDILVYCDAGNEWVGDMRTAIEGMDQDIMFFSNGWPHLDWCKMDVAYALLPSWMADFNGDDVVPTIELSNNKQVQASTFFVRVTPETRKFVREWHAWSIVPGMIDNEPSRLANVQTFQEHRWDQSILCCLQIKYRYRLHWFPTTTAQHLRANHPDDKYPVLLNHHRKRNDEW